MKKNKILLISIIIAISFLIIMFIDSYKKIQSEPIKDIQKQEAVKKPLPKEITYRIIEEEDISYINCKRVGIRLVVPDNSPQTDVNYTIQEIIKKYKNNWDDITIWAYKESEESQVGLIPYSMGMKEYSTCN